MPGGILPSAGLLVDAKDRTGKWFKARVLELAEVSPSAPTHKAACLHRRSPVCAPCAARILAPPRRCFRRTMLRYFAKNPS